MRKRYQKRHNYLTEILQAIQAGELYAQPGTVIILDVYHDSTCGIYQGGACDCRPDIIRRKTACARTGGKGREP